ncbi:MAG: carbohydrate-binding family 9-like protein [Phocaeicola sp.]|nr:carbohydrate-binding family 9-like protein [Phocaeicola sp.]
MNFKYLLLLLCICYGANSYGQVALSDKYASMLTRPRGYVAHRLTTPITIDGKADEKAWKQAPWTEDFVDISGFRFPTPVHRTRAKMLWDEAFFYVYAEIEEPHIWANLVKRDTIVYYDPDFEVFIDPRGEGHHYFEVEVNARGTIFDLSLEKPYRAPKRPFIQFQWDCPGMQMGIHLEGTLNYAKDTDRYWAVEIAIPREAIASEFENFLVAGRYLRVNFSRVQWQYIINKDGVYQRKQDEQGKYLPEDNWVWTPCGQIAMHMPERWGYVYLSPTSTEAATDFVYPERESLTRFLWLLFYAQEEQYKTHKCYFQSIKEFPLTQKDWLLLSQEIRIEIETTSHTYEIRAIAPDGKIYVINEDGCCFTREARQ